MRLRWRGATGPDARRSLRRGQSPGGSGAACARSAAGANGAHGRMGAFCRSSRHRRDRRRTPRAHASTTRSTKRIVGNPSAEQSRTAGGAA